MPLGLKEICLWLRKSGKPWICTSPCGYPSGPNKLSEEGWNCWILAFLGDFLAFKVLILYSISSLVAPIFIVFGLFDFGSIVGMLTSKDSIGFSFINWAISILLLSSFLIWTIVPCNDGWDTPGICSFASMLCSPFIIMGLMYWFP